MFLKGKLKNLTIGKKVIISLLLIFVCLLGIVAILAESISESKTQMQRIYNKNLVPAKHLFGISSIVKDTPFRMAAVLAGAMKGPSGRNKMNEHVDELSKILVEMDKIFNDLNFTNIKLKKGYKTLVDSLTLFNSFAVRLSAAFIQDSPDDLVELLEDDWPDIQPAIYNAMDALILGIQQDSLDVYKKSLKDQEKLSYISYVVSLLVALFILYNLYFFTKIFKTLSSCLTTNLDNILKTSNGVKQSNVLLVQRSKEQAISLSQTAATIEEITSSTKQTTEHIIKADQETKGAVILTKDAVEASNELSVALREMSNSSKKIEDIVDLVEEFAFRTNILAINASIEAAKAGDQGKGFAVISIEVRDLAQRVAEAANEISSLVTESKDDTTRGMKIFDANMVKMESLRKKCVIL